MDREDRVKLEGSLRRHYANQRLDVSREVIDSLAVAMVAEDTVALRARGDRIGLAAFVAGQVRCISPWTWVAQAAVVALMGLVACRAGDELFSKLAVGVLSASSVLVGIPTLHASRRYGVAELEYACRYNAASVTLARMIALGCSSALSIAVMVGLCASSMDADVFTVSLWACLPFFCSCAGSLSVLRRSRPDVALMASVGWTVLCCTVLIALAATLPGLYAQASVGAWVLAACVALGWLVREAMLTMQAVTAGLDALSPQLATTYN